MLPTVEIESGIPIPSTVFRNSWMNLNMNVGDSVRIEWCYENSISSRIRNHQKTHKTHLFTRRIMTDESGVKYVRVWRYA